jgi:tetrahydromethanopterin S-methyltransferase subunit B
VATSTKGDLTFAFASSDAKALVAEVTGVAAPGGASSVSYDAVELLDEVQRLERLAESAKHRLKGADPTNRTLVGARREGLTVFSLTADYARLLIDLETPTRTTT